MNELKIENKLLIISLLIIGCVAIYCIVSYIKWYNNYTYAINDTINECKNNTIKEREEYCNNLLSEVSETNPDFIYTVNTIIQDSSIIIYIVFLLIVIPTLYYVCKMFKSRNIIYQLTREKYKDFLKKMFKKAYTSILILPSMFLVIILFSIIFCNGFSTNHLFSQGLLESEMSNMISPIIYIIAIILKATIISIIYINISMIVARKNHNLYISIILSYLLYIGIEIFLEGLIGKILFLNIFKIDSMMLYFNIMNIFSLNLVKGYPYTFIPLILILILTTLIVIKMYKNKESLIIDCDKNN